MANNDITGDRLVTKHKGQFKYESNYDRIFRQKIEWEDEIVKERHDKSLKKGNKDE